MKVRKPFDLSFLKENPLKALEVVANKIKADNGFYASTTYEGMTVGVSKFPQKDGKVKVNTACFIAVKDSVELKTIREKLQKAGLSLNEVKIAKNTFTVDDAKDTFYLIKTETEGLLENKELIEKMAKAKELFRGTGELYELNEFGKLKSAPPEEIDYAGEVWAERLAKVSKELNMKVIVFPTVKDYSVSIVFDRGNTFVRKKITRGIQFSDPSELEVRVPSDAAVMGTNNNLFAVKPLQKGENLIKAVQQIKKSTAKKVDKSPTPDF